MKWVIKERKKNLTKIIGINLLKDKKNGKRKYNIK